MLGWGQMQELRQAILSLRAAKKDVYCYLEEARPDNYLLATAASRICIVPTGEIPLMGMHVEHAYFKNLMDKIGVEADIEHAGAYKGAGEPFTRTGPSDEAKQMTEWLVKDLFEQMIETVSQGTRHPGRPGAGADRPRPVQRQAGRRGQAVDDAVYVDELDRSPARPLRRRTPTSRRTTARTRKPRSICPAPSRSSSCWARVLSKKASAKPSVAVVYLDGMIVTGKTEQSPFGDAGAVGSTSLRHALTKARDGQIGQGGRLAGQLAGRVGLPPATSSGGPPRELGKEKPFVVSMGDVAASGGYYVSAGAKAIFANRGTITGSIGVITGKLITKGLWDWVGITFHETTIGQERRPVQLQPAVRRPAAGHRARATR